MSVNTADFSARRRRDLGQALTRRRVELGYPSRKDFAADIRGGLSYSVICDLETGTPRVCNDNTLARAEQQWQTQPGALVAYLASSSGPLQVRPIARATDRRALIRQLGVPPRKVSDADRMLRALAGDDDHRAAAG